MQMRLSQVAKKIQAEHIGEDAEFTRVSTDTRTIAQGDLFVALQGENFDGHDYVQQAQESGAAAAMVSRKIQQMLPVLKVEDTRIGLGQLAKMWRAQFNMPVASITGSNGKTTVKEMLAAIMACKGDVLYTLGNLNNDIGVPLTLMRMQEHHSSAVIEMGANHAGEIQYLVDLARPDVAVLTNAAEAHLEGFGSLEGVARAKGEIFSGLNMNGTGIINADDRFYEYWKQLLGSRRQLSFGLKSEADVTASWTHTAEAMHLQMQTPVGTCEFDLHLLGRHNIMNALAATAAALALGADLDMVRQGLEGLRPVDGRLQVKQGMPGMQVLNDTYNANPASYAAALDVLVSMPGKKCLVLGDMGELGEDSESLHAECGRLAKAKGVEQMYAVGDLARFASDAFGKGASWYANKQELLAQLINDWSGEGVVLVKGSRLMRMEQVVDALEEKGGQA